MVRPLIASAVLFTMIVLAASPSSPRGGGSLARAAEAPSAGEGAKKSAAATFEVYKDKAGEYRWRLRMQNTKVIASSGEGYSTKRACEEAIESVKKVAADAAVEEKASDAPAGAKE